jgi:xanthine dehydrogenase/oxidase
MLVAETWINHVAEFLKLPAEHIREINMYKEGQMTHFNQPLEDFRLPKLWSKILEISDYHHRRRIMEDYNRNNKWKKRGLAVVPTKYDHVKVFTEFDRIM